jgi:UDP-N-acetylmuramoyl-tripeptide--D-alanyl-D-alanine ligase
MMTLSDLDLLLSESKNGLASVTETPVLGFCIDSRQVKPGQVFVAIEGETFDGHDFMPQAVAAGAIGLVCLRKNSALSVQQWVVLDTVEALGRIATFHRQSHPCPAIALTGSNGKTTVKEMIASILPKPAFATKGNLNNHLGLPLSVLSLDHTYRFAVFELGANHIGEIAYTVAIANPQVTLINNIAPAHIAGFGSLEGVANAKGEIYEGLKEGGTAVINDDDHYAHYWDSILAGKSTLRFSLSHATDVYATALTFNAQGCGQFNLHTPHSQAWVELNVPGLHNVRNALAAAACTTALNIEIDDIVAGLSHFGGVPGRMTYRNGKNQALIIDDTYNANLRSTLAAIDVLSQRQGVRIFVFGDMKELGDWSQPHHEEVGKTAREKGIDFLLTFGEHSRWTQEAFGHQAKHFENKHELIEYVLPKLDEHTSVLVKGSRSSAMEEVVRYLLVDENTGGVTNALLADTTRL